MKKKVSVLMGTRRFRRVAVLGGGPSLAADMARLPIGVLLIAAGDDALALCEELHRRPDYVVYTEDAKRDLELQVAVKVSLGESSDLLLDVPVWSRDSACLAAWLGLWMGCNPVILCGMDIEGEDLLAWMDEAPERCLFPKRLRAMSGPLVEVFGAFRVDEII